MWSRLFLLVAWLPALVFPLGPTDEIQDADPAQSGYMSNHNLHPATVGSPIFGILWKNTYGKKELFFAKALTYTPLNSDRQIVFLASAMNYIRTVDAINGTLVKERLIQPPFLQSDIGCTDIPNYIGIIGTPIIDPTTDTVYFFSKGYEGGAANGGVARGRYKFFAVDFNTLEDKPGFPVLIDGNNADNDPQKYFVGGTVLQRPSLTMLNGVVVGGFGGHCDLFNYTGMLVAVSTTPGVGVTSIYAMEGGQGANPVVLDIFTERGGRAGIWQGGMGFATDKSRIFFATGNGQGHANGDIPASGRVPLTTLDDVVAEFSVSAAGKFGQTDYFEPYEFVSMDAADRDLGSSGVALLDPDVFQGTGVARMAVCIGKNGKAYVLNADNLGGFKQGPGGTDNVLQTIIAQGAVFGGVGSYPLEGGYIYFTPVGHPTVCYKLGHDASGRPFFTFVGQTATNSAGRVGIGIPTVTTYKGQPGTGILWVTDPNVGVQAFNAVPDANGTLTPIPLPPTGGLSKFQRPGFGNGRAYVSDSNGNVYCLGSPVALPLNCSQPVDFGSVITGTTQTVIVNCTALIPLNGIGGCTTGDPLFKCSNSTLPKGALAQGAMFSFPVTWNLTQASINDAQNASFGKVLPGVARTSLNIYTNNAVPKYSNVLPITLQGTTVSKTAFLVISPPEVDFGGIVVNGSDQASGLSSSAILSNIGSKPLLVTGLAWTHVQSNFPIFNNLTTNADNLTILGANFSSTSFLKVGDILDPGQSVTVRLLFNTGVPGSYQSIVQIWSNGGDDRLLLSGSASTSPVVTYSVSTVESGWDFSDPLVMDFGDVPFNSTKSRNIRVCNIGGSALSITKSKPPVDDELFAARPLTDLHEGQSIDVNTCALGEIDIVPAVAVINQPAKQLADVWILNTDGFDQLGSFSGLHEVQIKATIIRRQIGPLLPDGTARYMYLGCYQDLGRLLPKAFNGGQNNENGYCQSTCQSNGYRFAGTEYHVECWCGNTPPPISQFHPEAEKKCTFSCPADTTQACGGVGGYISIFYDSLNYDPNSNSTTSTAPSSTTSGSTPTTSGSTSTTSRSAPTTSNSSYGSTPTSVSSTSSVTGPSAASSSTSSSPSTTSTTMSSSSAQRSSSTTSSSSSASSSSSSTAPSGSDASTSSSIVSASTMAKDSTSTSASSSATPTLGFYPLGCFSDPAGGPFAGHIIPILFRNDSVSVDLCIQAALARLTAVPATTYRYIGLEYGRECYAATSAPTASPATVTGPGACTMTCKGNSTQKCGGRNQLNVYTSPTPTP